MAMAYIAIARGSPCVVVSLNMMVLPSMNWHGSDLYMLASMVLIAGHLFITLLRAAFLFNWLNTFDASTSRIVSVAS